MIQTETGGGFGGKEEYPSLIAGHAALLAWKSGKPVKIMYDRAEDMVATTKRHPSKTKHRTAVSKDGKLLGDGDRFCDRWRRLLHAVAGGAFARDDSRGRALLLSERAHPEPRRRDQHSAARSAFAALARRRASLRSNGNWTKLRRRLGSPAKSFAAATSFTKAKPRPPAR